MLADQFCFKFGVSNFCSNVWGSIEFSIKLSPYLMLESLTTKLRALALIFGTLI